MNSTRHQVVLGILVALILGGLVASCAGAEFPRTWPRLRAWPRLQAAPRITAQPAVVPHDAAPDGATDPARAGEAPEFIPQTTGSASSRCQNGVCPGSTVPRNSGTPAVGPGSFTRSRWLPRLFRR
jgi:hypothetical protein